MPITINGNGTVTGLSVGGLPDGTVDRDTLATAAKGSILQVVQTFKSDQTSFTSASTTTYADITGMSVAITPSSSSNKIFVLFSVNVGCSTSGRNNSIRLLRDSTNIADGTNGSETNANLYDRTVANNVIFNMSNMYLDSPSTTSATTYKLQWACEGSGGNQTYYLNRRGADSNFSSGSHITVMEVAG